MLFRCSSEPVTSSTTVSATAAAATTTATVAQSSVTSGDNLLNGLLANSHMSNSPTASTNSTQVYADVVDGDIVEPQYRGPAKSLGDHDNDDVDHLLDDRRIMENIIEISERAKGSFASAAAAGLRLSATDTNLATAVLSPRIDDFTCDSDYDNMPSSSLMPKSSRKFDFENCELPCKSVSVKSVPPAGQNSGNCLADTSAERLFVEEGSTESETETKVEEFTDPVTGRARRRRIKITRKTKTIRERILRTGPANCMPASEGPLPPTDDSRSSYTGSCASSAGSSDVLDLQSCSASAASSTTAGSRASCSDVLIRRAGSRPTSQSEPPFVY